MNNVMLTETLYGLKGASPSRFRSTSMLATLVLFSHKSNLSSSTNIELDVRLHPNHPFPPQRQLFSKICVADNGETSFTEILQKPIDFWFKLTLHEKMMRRESSLIRAFLKKSELQAYIQVPREDYLNSR